MYVALKVIMHYVLALIHISLSKRRFQLPVLTLIYTAPLKDLLSNLRGSSEFGISTFVRSLNILFSSARWWGTPWRMSSITSGTWYKGSLIGERREADGSMYTLHKMKLAPWNKRDDDERNVFFMCDLMTWGTHEKTASK